NIIVSVGPERVVGIGIEGVIEEILVGIGPEQRAEPAYDDRPEMTVAEWKLRQPPAERGARQRRPIGEEWVAQHVPGSMRAGKCKGTVDLIAWCYVLEVLDGAGADAR